MSYQDIIAAFIVGLLIGSGNIIGGVFIYILYNKFIRDEEFY